MPTLNSVRVLPIATAITSLMGSSVVAVARPIFDAKPISTSTEYMVAQTTAPTGTYTAQQGDSKVAGRITRRSATSDSGTVTKRRKNSTVPAVTSSTASFVINSFTSAAELQAISKAASAGSLTEALAPYNHGTVTITGYTYPIQMATYRVSQGNYEIQIISGFPTSKAKGSNSTMTGNSVAMTVLKIPTTGAAGTGTYYQSVQVTVSRSGAAIAQSGASSSTALLNVQKK